MEYIWYIIAGLFGGVVAGMGMGGGTILIPALTIFLGVEQHHAQGINLVAFIPAAIISIIIHAKNKLVAFKVALPIIIAGTISSAGAVFLALALQGNTLRKLFAVFLIAIGIYQLYCAIKQVKAKKKPPKEGRNIKVYVATTSCFK